MRVVMGVHVRRGGADEHLEPRELALELGGDALGLDLLQLQMEPEAQGRALASEGDRLLAGRPVHHQARARENPVAVCLDDAAIDPSGDPEVISGHDEQLHEGL